MTIPANASENWPQAVMLVDADTPRGLYEFGCRLLNPITGERLDEDSDLFEVQ